MTIRDGLFAPLIMAKSFNHGDVDPPPELICFANLTNRWHDLRLSESQGIAVKPAARNS